MENSQEEIEAGARILMDSKKVVALTGAGISVESGIPDFRSPGGIWTRYDPTIYATLESFVNDPSKFWSLARDLHPLLETAEPNLAHLMLVELEKLGKCEAVITQNIDNLHQKAGSGVVLELHGTFRSGKCVRCGEKCGFEELEEFTRKGSIPRCGSCGSPIKPDVVLFGEPLPPHVLKKASELAQTCDLMLVVGCGLEVFPAASLPILAHRKGGKLIFVNVVKTAYDHIADVVLRGKAGEVLPKLVEEYRKLSSTGASQRRHC
ncbi:MAG: NAD-dependent deacylase [Actinomycetota bacterium]|nr:NAD-dependent deacylase [Actinomycetota bacterium]